MGTQSRKNNQITKKAIRIISNSKYNAHTEPLFKKMKVLTVTDIHKLCKLKLFYKLENNTLPPYFWHYMFSANRTNKTRNKDPYQQMVPKTVIFSDSIRFSLPILLRNTPPLIKSKAQTHSYNGYTQYIKKYMIEKYRETCIIPDVTSVPENKKLIITKIIYFPCFPNKAAS